MNNKSNPTILKKPVWWLSVLILSVFVMAGCQPAAAPSPAPAVTSAPEAASTPTSPAAPSASPTPAAAAEAIVNVATDAKLGQILVDGKGMTLYMFTKDGPDQSNCSGDCLKAWPPLLTLGKPTLGEGVDPALVGTATLADGSMIVTYNKMPLYYWNKDTQPGDTTGQGNKDVWYVVSPDGNSVGN